MIYHLSVHFYFCAKGYYCINQELIKVHVVKYHFCETCLFIKYIYLSMSRWSGLKQKYKKPCVVIAKENNLFS